MTAKQRPTSFAEARKRREERFEYTAENARESILDAFDLFEHREQREHKWSKAELERKNRKAW